MSASAGPSPVAQGGALTGRSAARTLIGIGAVIVAGMVWEFWPSGEAPPVRTQGQANWGLVAKAPEEPQAANPAAPPAPRPPAKSAEPAQSVAAVPSGEKQRLALGFYRNPAYVPAAVAIPTQAAGADGMGDPSDLMGAAGQQSEYAQRMRITAFPDSTPVPPRTHNFYTIKENSEFDCLPSRPIASNLPGPISCMIVNAPVWNMDGDFELLPIGTEISGTIERGLQTGEDRMFVAWNLATTPKPNRKRIPLTGVGADPLGQVGVPGDRDDHVWAKLKTTLMVSGIQLLTSLPQAALSGGHNNTYISGLSGGLAPSLSQMAFMHDMNIPTTAYRGPGQPIKIVTTSAIDLVNYYRGEVARKW